MKTLWKTVRERENLSEREIAGRAGVSRSSLRAVESGQGNSTLETLFAIGRTLQRRPLLLLVPDDDTRLHSSTVASSLKIMEEGFDSWPIYLMEMVDDFRKTLDPRLLLLPPAPALDRKLIALLASTAVQLCEESGADVPAWARRRYYLPEPWFVAKVDALKASAILESPWAFRNNNIFVLQNFLDRA